MTKPTKLWRGVAWKSGITLFIIFLMSQLDTSGGPCGQGILVVFLLPFLLLFGIWAIVSAIRAVKLQRAES